MYKIVKNKKGIGIDALLPYLLVAIFIIFIVFLNVNYTAKKKEAYVDIEVKLSSIEAEQKLLDFLEKKVEIEKENISIADLITKYYYEKKYKEILVKEIETMLDSLPKPAPASGWNLNIYLMPEEEKILKVVIYDVIGWFKKESIITYMPLTNNPEENLKLDLWLECQC